MSGRIRPNNTFHAGSMHPARKRRQSGFTLIEVIVAAAILGLGLLAIVQVFPYGIEVSRRAEDTTKATLLAQSMFEGLKMDPVNYPILPGAPNVLIPIPGNCYDDDTNNVMFDPERIYNRPDYLYDLNSNRKPDTDYDGLPEADGVPYSVLQPNGIDDDGDGVIDDTGDSSTYSRRGIPRQFANLAPDGDYYYDPEPNIDEEFANGIDDDGDGLIDEDCRLASVRVLGSQYVMMPLLAGDGIDNDGDGEFEPDRQGLLAVKDGLDNNNDGRIDEGIDEEIWDGVDNDGDGRIDEDCRLASFPFCPAPFPPPYERYSWKISVGRIPNDGRFGITDINGDGTPDLGNGIDDDGDGFVDEELPDGLDYDFPIVAGSNKGLSVLRGYTQQPRRRDGLVDEDCIAAPLPGWLRVEILITWGGDGEDNDGDRKQVDPTGSDEIAPNDPRVIRKQRLSYGGVSWGVDEEKLDGLDNDLDGLIDEDVYLYEYTLIGFINLNDPSQSFTLTSGQPRGVLSLPLTGM